MKKLILCTILLLSILGTAGCSKEEKFINSDEITEDTILAKDNGVLQVATSEDFDKSYYNLSELKDFIKKEIDTYNEKAGEKRVTFEDVQLRSGKAIMLLSYSDMETYSIFNNATAAYFSGGVDNISLDLPTTLVNAKNDSLASTTEVLQNEKYKILVMYEPYNIMVDGKVKFYSEGAELIDDSTVKGVKEGLTVVVFKP